jgi:TolB-like protein/class 3 adenylate cyclase/Tfp pilus assembly protein PilF
MLLFERRFAAILSADIAGYCRLMGLDDELTVERLLRYREILKALVAASGGRIFGMAGDAWMAEFESAAPAVRCAIDCQQEIEKHNLELPENRRIRFRIGLNLGAVLASDPDLYGDGVNIAARLQEKCRPGDIVMSEAVFFQARTVLNGIAFKPLGRLQLKNIEGHVSAFACEIAGTDNGTAPENLVAPVDVSQPVPGFEGRPAIAVLPFHVSNASPNTEYLGEALAEDLLTGLSNLRWLPVISSASSFIFKNQSLDTVSIGRALGTRYLVTGSVRQAGSNLRINVSLVDAASGSNLWTHRYEIEFDKLFAVQDQIVGNIVAVLESEVDRVEQSRSRSRKFEELDTWGLIRRGIWHLNKLTKQDAAIARELIEDAARRDENSAEARIHLAWCQFWDVWSKRGNLSLMTEVERIAREAIRLDPRDARGHLLVGIALFMMKKPEQGRPHLYTAISLNPSLATAHSCLGSSFLVSGDPDKAITPLLLSIRLNPYDVYRFHFLGELAMAFYMQGEWEKACEFAERSLQVRPNYWYAKAVRVASLARSGQMERARALISESSYQFSLEEINWVPFVDKKCNNFIVAGLELAGCRVSGNKETALV